MKGMLEAADVTIPSCFIITNQKQGNPQTSDTMTSIENKITSAQNWLDKLSQIGAALADDPLSAMMDTAIASLTDGETLYLYLVDESTMQPVVMDDDPVYPIEITVRNENNIVPKILPLLKVTDYACNCNYCC